MRREVMTFESPGGLEMNLDAAQLTSVIARLEAFICSPECVNEIVADMWVLLQKLRAAKDQLATVN